MVRYICGKCGKNNFRDKRSAKNHLEHSHKEEILNSEVNSIDKSVPVYIVVNILKVL